MNNIAYFDNAATTFPKPEDVYLFTDGFYRECGVNVGRGQYHLATKAASMVAETRKLLLELNHCLNKNVVFSPSATEAINIILRGIGLTSGSNVYISPFEHNAVTRVLHHISSQSNIKIMELSFDKNAFSYDLERIKYQFADVPPNLVIISHASNVCGVVAPIKAIFELAKKYSAITVVDMCQTMGLIDTDLSGPEVDYAVFAGHKTLYAPLGIAGFICADDSVASPLLFGGTGVDSANQNLPVSIPEKYEVGSANVAAIAGLNAALKWNQSIGIDNLFAHEKHNHLCLLSLLQQYDNIRLVSPANSNISIGVVSCVFDGYESDSIGQVLNEHGVAVRTGLHCAPSAHRFLGTFPAGTVRFSVGYFNTDSDFEMLQNALTYIRDNG